MVRWPGPMWTVRTNNGKDIVSASAFGINGWYVNVTAYVPSGETGGLDVETGLRLQGVVDGAVPQ